MTLSTIGSRTVKVLLLVSFISAWSMEVAAREPQPRPTRQVAGRSQSGSLAARRSGKVQYRAYRSAAVKFLKTASPRTRQVFGQRDARAGLMALGAVLTRTKVNRGLLLKVLNNPHALAHKDPRLQPIIFPALKAMARLGNIKGTSEVLKRAALSVKDEGGTRGALFELVAGSAVKRMGYKLDGLSYQIGAYETDGKVDNGTSRPSLVNMKSITLQRVIPRTIAKAEDQLRLRNGTASGRPRADRNPAMLVIGQMPGVDLKGWNWKETAKNSGADLTVIRVDPNTGRGQEIFRAGKNQLKQP